MKTRNFWSTGAATLALLAAAAPAMAQQISANVNGSVKSDAGAAVAGAQVKIVDTRTNQTITTRTSADGSFAASGLAVGGPYSVTVHSDKFGDQQVNDVFLTTASDASLTFALSAAQTQELVVVATRNVLKQKVVGPNSNFTADQIEGLPSIARDVRDTLRVDPRVLLSVNAQGTQTQLSCLGGNNRSNSFTVDGVSQGDTFGLNASAFQNRFGNPYPIAASASTSVEFAPFDVQYDNFTGCNINVTTKQGTNQFHGGGFGEYTSDGLTGTKIESQRITRPLTRNYRWGADVGGALIKDRVFFYVAYEQIRLGGSPVDVGPAGAGFATSQPFLSTQAVDQIRTAIQRIYGYDPGGIVFDQPQTSRRILTRWDFNISARHHLAFTYSRFNEAQIQSDDGPPSRTVFDFGNTFQTQGTVSRSYSARLFSNWTNNFSTEIRASRSDVQDIQNPLGGFEAQGSNPVPRVVIGITADGTNGTTAGATGVVIAGPGFSRTANDLRTQIDQIRGIANYKLNKHYFTFGYDFNQLDAFNLFVQNATGTLSFSSLTNFLNNTTTTGSSTAGPNTGNLPGIQGTLSGILANGRGGNQFINGAAASFSRSISSFYAQDKYRIFDPLEVTLGLRYDRYFSNTLPQFNASFQSRYGFSNTQGFNGLQLFQPRLSFKYDAPKALFGDTKVNFGAGVFGGGDPTVFFSNSYSNTGFNFATANSAGTGSTCTAANLATAFSGGVFQGLPSCILQQEATGILAGSGPVNAADPNLKLPSVIRANFDITHITNFGGAAHGLFDNWQLNASYIHSAFRNSFRFEDLAQAIVGTTSVGGFRYQTVDPLLAGCNLRFAGIGQGFTGTYTTACNGATSRSGDIVLTNVDGGSGNSDTLAVSADKTFNYSAPFIDLPGSLHVILGYAFTNSRDRSNNGATTAASGVTNTVVPFVLNELPTSPSGFFAAHNITLTVDEKQEFFRDLTSRFTFFFNVRSGSRFTYAAAAAGIAPGLNSNSFYQLYVPSSPLATGDPRVTYASTFNLAAFNQFIADNGLEQFRGGFVPRNFSKNDYFFDLDFSFKQDLPTPVKGFKVQFYATINNLLNLIGREGNIFRSQGGDRSTVVNLANFSGPIVAGAVNPITYSTFVPGGVPQTVNVNASAWQAKFGLEFKF